jgi:hypothetical protein
MTFSHYQKAAVALLCITVGAKSIANPQQDPVEVDTQEQLKAAQLLGGSRKLALSDIQGRHIDGVKGYKVYPVLEGPSLAQNEQLQKLVARMACKATVFGLVELEAAKSFVGKNDIAVFTKYRFRILEDWHVEASQRDSVVHLIMHGGEVTHAGEKYRVDNPYASYKIGGRYVLMAGSADKNAPPHSIFETPPFLEVSDDLIYPAPGWTPFARGTTLEQARAAVSSAVGKEGCK